MGNTIGRSKRAKVMKVDGETFKVKMPATANDVVKDYPGHVLLDSQAVKHFGLRARPLEPNQELKPKKIYFVVELPKVQEPEEVKTASSSSLPRRVRSSGIQGMKAKDRLELLMLSKRSVSDLALVRQPTTNVGLDGPMRVKMRLPRAQLEKLMEESNDGTEVAEKIMRLYAGEGGGDVSADDGGVRVSHHHGHKPRGKRVSFSPMENEVLEEAVPQ
ncbi:uncharacterized protein At1g66480-like isoform X1 [Lotus japonicus]|uniref:uncharacterized protein At1g66480-like isoform X1 n=1 Tax=Lotus japonicus TaxID=34305 RepID=UPI002583F61B|nr:uncharacterized protein At1g66480-like isoform X1 [Lotus japonicus]